MAEIQELPDWLYVFVNPGSLSAVFNLETNGQYSSPVMATLEDPSFAATYSDGGADFLPFIQNPVVSTGFLSPFTVGVMNEYRVEHDAELARRTYFRDAPSRFTGIFAFESMEACQQVSQKFRWPLDQVERFQPQNVLRATRVNMEIVSLARRVYARAGVDPALLDALWRAYWGGADSFAVEVPSIDAKSRETLNIGAIWEWIVDGALLHERRVESSS